MEFNLNPYYDDFEATNGPQDNNYMRILFKPGYAVQARELTQIQSIIQNQIKQFGDHIFKDGSPVIGGHLSLDVKVKSIKLQTQYALEDINVSDYNGKLILSDTNVDKKAYVIAVDDTQEYPTLLVRYLSGSEFSDSETIKVASSTTTKATLIASGASTTGSAVSIDDGVFYVNGYFVKVAPQTIVLDPYSTTPTFRVGLAISDGVVTASDDSMLLDPAQASFNYQAPGADRYQFDLVLSHRTLDSTDDSAFFELLRVEGGSITKQVNYPIYSELEKTLARRTYDESGNYTVNPWRVTPSANTANTAAFDLQIEKGKAYVKGYEFETQSTTTLNVSKARTSNVSSDYELSVEYGNYVVVKNLFGGNTSYIFDTNSYEQIDLHCVPSANINTASASLYSNTKIGTARVRNITNRGDGSTYNMQLLDINTSPIITTVATYSADANSILLPTNFSTTNNAYRNVYVSVLSGPGAGDIRKIISYDGSTVNKKAVVDRNFSVANLGASSIVSLNFSTADLESLVISPGAGQFGVNVYGTKNVANAYFACADIDAFSKANRDPLGDTFIYSTDLNKMVFPFPETYIANGSFSNATQYQRKMKSVSFVSGSKQLVSPADFDDYEEIYYGTNGSNLSVLQILSNILVVISDKGSSNALNGQVVDFTRVGASILRNGSQDIVLNSGYTGDFTADIFYNVKVNNSSVNTRRTKTLKGDSTITALRSTDAPNGTSVTGATNVKYDTTNAFVWFTNTADLVKTPGAKQSLYIPDVFNIIKIYDSGNPLYAPNTVNAIDITGNYFFDSGQNDNYYDHASIILRDTANPPAGQIVVMTQYFEHSSTGGYFNADSYDYNTIYSQEKIPLYSSKNGSFSLRDCIDFRPTRTVGTTAFTLTGNKIPFPDLSMVLTYGFYLPRIDKLIATQNKEFKLLSGVASFVPAEPGDSDEGMTLYTLYIPPFTANIRDIKLKYFDNRRYTMRDIAALDKRLQQVEYYTTLSLLENKARSQSVLYQDSALQKEKYGILVDQFDGFNIADNKSQDLLCQLSFNELKPYKVTQELALNFVNGSGAYSINDKTCSLSYTETPIVSQQFATKAISVQPYLFAQFLGAVKMTPDSDYWMSTRLTPVVNSPPGDVITPATPPIAQPTTPVTGGTVPARWGNAFSYYGGSGGSIGIGNFVGYGYVNWNDFLNIRPSVPVQSGPVQQAIIAPDISNSVAISGGGGGVVGDGRFQLKKN
jgi:hypothetical protein